MEEIIIRPKSHWNLIEIKEIIKYRELMYIFTWRDIKVRYKQTVLGVLWVVFQPLASAGIFSIFFGKLANISSGNLPYPLFVFGGLVIWSFFSNTLSRISECMVAEQGMIKKIYFPKIILPLSIILTNIVDLMINLIALLIIASLAGFAPSLKTIIMIPCSILLAAGSAFGLGLFLTSLNVKYRDVRYILPYFIQILLFATPVIYPMAIMSERNRILVSINPMSSAVELIRYSFTKNAILYPELILLSISVLIFIILLGLWYFRRTEQFFADII
jgi:lipopolysaccharide transport system permease protein